MIGRTISHYRILEQLGRGGMGEVFKAHDEKLERTVALKFLPAGELTQEQDRLRFINEGQAAAALNHPAICVIHEIDEVEERVFIAMEYVEGRTVKELIQEGPLDLERALDIAIQIAEGLHEAHSKGVVHRDIKSSNIIVTAGGRAKLMDFGIAKIAGTTSVTSKGSTPGTVSYMSPEQAQGDGVDARTDIWSLGVVLYEMLTGKLPFAGDYDAAVVYSIVEQDPRPLSEVRSGVPMKLEQLVLEMLDKDIDRRIQNAEELLTGLRYTKALLKRPDHSGTERSILVLPFTDISPQKEGDYFSDGLAEELMTGLSRLKDMRVVSRTTSMRYKSTSKNAGSIGREVGVRYIMEGSVRRIGDDLRISVQLVDVASDTQLWAETYRGYIADVFDIQEKVSKQIVDALSVKLTPTERVVLSKRPTLNPEAFDLCLRGRDCLYKRTRSDLDCGIDLFKKAIDLDPRYAAAYAGLGETYGTLYQDFDRNADWLEKSIDACLRALMYDATLAEAYAALSLAHFHKGAISEALVASQKAIDLDPTSFTAYWILGRICHSTERDREAVDCFERVIELNPDFYTAYKDMLMCYERMENDQRYREILDTLLVFYPEYLSRNPHDSRARLYFAVNLAEAGRGEDGLKEAEEALRSAGDDTLMLYNAACFYSRINDRARAVETLRRSIDAGFGYYDWIKTDPDLENIRGEPDYLAIMKDR
jgi:serine/threonine protein kinase/tetratricopeptide (TPR) repeat protein